MKAFLSKLLVGVTAVLAFSAAHAGAIDDAVKRGTLKVGMDPTYMPFEMTNKRGQIIGFEVDLLKAGGLHEAAQLFERADLIRAQIGKIYFCRFHWKYLRDQKTFSFSGGPPPAFLILLCLRGTVNRKKAPDT